MTINDKIKQILIDKDITPSYFADAIGVQRSSVSHILSGRNRPSFDVIQKVIRRFPELGYEWIMEEDEQSSSKSSAYGNGRLPTRIPDERSQLSPPSSARDNQPTPRPQRNEVIERPATSVALKESAYLAGTNESATRKVERIIVFYSDGSFQEYIPSA